MYPLMWFPERDSVSILWNYWQKCLTCIFKSWGKSDKLKLKDISKITGLCPSKISRLGVPVVVQRKQIWPVSMRIRVWSLASLSVLGSSMAVNHRGSLDPELLWLLLWHRPSAVALIWLLAWELPYTIGVALKSKKKKKIRGCER